jgi:hypothetical protein
MKAKQTTIFLTMLAAVAHLYKWSIAKDGRIVGTQKGKQVKEHDPITAIVNPRLRAKHQNVIRYGDTHQAAKQLKLDETTRQILASAIYGKTHRGYSQIMRGKIKTVLGLK